MKIEILSSAMSDLAEGRQFYEEQSEGLGEYFFESLFSDIDSLTLYPEYFTKFFASGARHSPESCSYFTATGL